MIHYLCDTQDFILLFTIMTMFPRIQIALHELQRVSEEATTRTQTILSSTFATIENTLEADFRFR